MSQRFPQNSIGAVGSAMFLRFVNPAIVSPYEAGILDKKPLPRIERGLKLMSKVCHIGTIVLVEEWYWCFSVVVFYCHQWLDCFLSSDPAEYCQPRLVYQGGAHETIQRLCKKQLWCSQAVSALGRTRCSSSCTLNWLIDWVNWVLEN